MVCQHLRQLELAIKAADIIETHRGQVWTENCREWVYFDCLLDLRAIRGSFHLDAVVSDHTNDDPRSGREAGLTCEACKDAIMGAHPADAQDKLVFPAPSQ